MISEGLRSKVVVCAVVVVALAVASCRAVAPGVYLVRVFNQSHDQASLHSAQPGFLGTPILGFSRTDAVQGCSAWSTAFDAGPLSLTITSATSTLTVPVTSDISSPVAQAFVIRPSGTIEQLYRVPGLQAGEPSPPPLCAASSAPTAAP